MLHWGGGELAYWLQLKSYFNSENITFPMLLLRNSVLITTKKQLEKADKLGLSTKELFKKKEDLIADKIRQFSTFSIDFTPQIELLQNQFLCLHELAKQTDKSFLGAVSAQEKKQLKGLKNLEKRLLKANKIKHRRQININRNPRFFFTFKASTQHIGFIFI